MTKEQIEQAAKEWVSKNYPDVLFQNRLVEIVVKFATSPEAAAYHGQGCDPDFTLWVVVNKWEYDYRTHEWVNNYIKEVAEASMKHSELYQFYLKRKPLQSPPQTDQP